jgi:hypothetical protein
MFNRFSGFRSAITALIVAGATLLTSASALADKLHLKDGRVLEGTVVRQGDGFVFFKFKVGSVSNEQLFTTDQILKIEKDSADAPKKEEGETPAGEKEQGDAASIASTPSESAEKKPGVTRIAVLNFGPPRSWKGEADSMVGGVIQAKFWDQAIPLLKKDKVDLVVVRVNSGGGALLEIERFHKVYEEKYKPNFRTVAWIESAISAAAMSPWVLEEIYFMKDGSMGACTGFSGALNAIKGFELEQVLYMMEKASELGKKHPSIMRAMQIQEPLSVDFDDQGNSVWRQDESGSLLLNRKQRVFTFTSSDAVKSKFAKGIANDLDELAKAMNIQEWELGGKAATELIDDSMRDADKAEKSFISTYRKYALALDYARGNQDPKKRGEFVAQARRHLEELRRKFKDNWLAAAQFGIDSEDWFREQERLLKELVGP